MTTELPHVAKQGLSLRLGAFEWWLVAALFLTGIAVRAGWPSRLAVEHFDEGVYASNIFFSGDKGDEHYPDQHLYAPPLVPFLIECAMLVLGPSNLAAMVVNIAIGSLTIPLVWWVARRWFGPVAGLASATLVALDDVHIVFSRTALTDIPLCFWLVAAVYCFWESLTTGSRIALVAAGVATALAWWTKYNGWLPLAIGLAGLIAWQLAGHCCAARAEPDRRPNVDQILRPLTQSLGNWAVMAAIAVSIWAPWLWSLQPKGGYSRVAENHRGYLVGLTGWWDSLSLQAAKLGRLEGALSFLSVILVLVVCCLFARHSNRRCTWNMLLGNRSVAILLLAGSLVGVAIGISGVLAIVAAGGIVGVLSCRESGGALPSKSKQLAGWLLASWFAGLLVMIPFYTPYPRLTLPWLMVCWLGCGAAVSACVQSVSSLCGRKSGAQDGDVLDPLQPAVAPEKIPRGMEIVVAACLMAAILFWTPGAWSRGVPGWNTRTSLFDQAPRLIDDACRSVGIVRTDNLDQLVIYTYGDPALLFQLRLAGVRWVRPLKSLAVASPDAPTPRLASFVVLGPQSRRTTGFTEQFAVAKNRLELIGSYSYYPSDLVVLDGADFRATRTEEVLEIYRVK